MSTIIQFSNGDEVVVNESQDEITGGGMMSPFATVTNARSGEEEQVGLAHVMRIRAATEVPA